MIDTLQIADELADGGVFTRDQAERLARLSAKAAGEALATKADLNATESAIKADLRATETSLRSEMALLESRLETAIERAQKSLVMWFAGIMVVHATAVVALTVGLVKLL
jgi:hypothetical protein